jgi:hypothetical protein
MQDMQDRQTLQRTSLTRSGEDLFEAQSDGTSDAPPSYISKE